MSFEFLLPLIGAGACAALTYRAFAPQNRAENLTFVEDEVPLAAIKGETLVLTRTEQMFKVVELAGQSVAGKRSDDLEKAASARALFYRNVSENKVHFGLSAKRRCFPRLKKPRAAIRFWTRWVNAGKNGWKHRSKQGTLSSCRRLRKPKSMPSCGKFSPRLPTWNRKS